MEETKKEAEHKESVEPVRKKVDVSKLASIIPPASELRRREEKIREKRIRIRWDEGLPEGVAKVPKELARVLGIKNNDLIEVVVAGRHKFTFKALIEELSSPNEVYCNPSELKERGVADKSIATIRKKGG